MHILAESLDEGLIGVNETGAVSYTHLDVYKRQVDDSTSFQVYNNINTSERTDQAVNETYGQMLFYNNKPIEAFYYSTSCGHGADGSVWGKEGEALPYLRSMQIKKGARELTAEDNATFDEYIRSQNITSYRCV